MAGDLPFGAMAYIIYDGMRFQLLNIAATPPAAFDLWPDVPLEASAISGSDRFVVGDDSETGDPNRYVTASTLKSYVAATPASSFDIHDDVTIVETIVDADRLIFSDESAGGDPMRYTTASALADYMQTEVQLNTSRLTAGTVATQRLGSGTADSTTYLRGDRTWAAVAGGSDSFDIHDDLSSAAIAAADRIPFSDESSGGDPMRYTTASDLKSYVLGALTGIVSLTQAEYTALSNKVSTVNYLITG